MLKISIIGSGNLAWHLGPALDNAGYIIKEVYSRNPRHAAALTGRLYQAEVKASLDFSTSESDAFIIAASDDAIESIAAEIILPEDVLLIHTSGSISLDALQYAATANTGVFFPLQSFSKNKRVDFKTIPVFIESRTEEVEKKLMAMAKAVSGKVRKITSEERRALFVASVFADNFTNHMLSLSKEILEKNSLSFELMKPLVQEMLTKTMTVGPEKSQTGPAMQGNLRILDDHLEFLKEDGGSSEIYKLISQHILDRYQVD